ncbi:hypothetical protein [Maridesulfovibrio sp.]|uniref:hypothetical protein n=1 Tax=Maridesulfovibrio sp. TaxID=2795000 RepID=UPI002A1882D4|nr:hypothetical protein [Maridesulfovibrio sp.]
MSRSHYRFFGILLCAVLLVPVCVVLAGEGVSWRVFMPVIRPLDFSANGPCRGSVQIAGLKRPVSNVVISAGSDSGAGRVIRQNTPSSDSSLGISLVSSGGELRRAEREAAISIDEGLPSEMQVSAGSGTKGRTASSHVDSGSKGTGNNLMLASSEGTLGGKDDPRLVSTQKVDSYDRYMAPSVSLVPSDSAEEKQWKSSTNGMFFTTPKRFLGLGGTLIKAVPSLSIMETYDSNIDATDIADLVTEVTPGLSFDVYGEKAVLKFNGNFIYRDYLENSKFDRYDYNVDLAGKYKFSPTVEGGLSLSHKRFHNLDQNTYESGGVQLDPSIILSTTATPEVTWLITERDSIRFSNYVDKTDYERASDSDYITNVFSTVWGHQLPNEVTSLFLGQMSTYTHFSREVDNLNSDQVSFQAIVGIDHQFSPAWKISLKGGPGTTFSNYASEYTHGKSEDFLYQVRAELGYRTLKFALVPALERIVRPGRYGENEVLDQAEIYSGYAFSEFFKYETINTVWLNETEGTNGGQKHKGLGVFTQHVLRWQFAEDWAWIGGLNYNWGRDELTGSSSERFKTWMGFTYSYPTEIN